MCRENFVFKFRLLIKASDIDQYLPYSQSLGIAMRGIDALAS